MDYEHRDPEFVLLLTHEAALDTQYQCLSPPITDWDYYFSDLRVNTIHGQSRQANQY